MCDIRTVNIPCALFNFTQQNEMLKNRTSLLHEHCVHVMSKRWYLRDYKMIVQTLIETINFKPVLINYKHNHACDCTFSFDVPNCSSAILNCLMPHYLLLIPKGIKGGVSKF